MRAFKRAPLITIVRGLHLGLLILLRAGSVIAVRFGSTRFRFNYVHGQRFGGGRGVFLSRERIEDLMEFGDQFLRRGDTVIDCGANQGVFTTAFATYVGSQGRVLAFEPMKYACDLIEKNLSLNGLENTMVVNAAVSDREGTATLDVSHGVGAASISNDYGGAETVQVETVTIDEVVQIRELGPVNFMKLDIEGAELIALRGAARTIARDRPIVCLEISGHDSSDADVAAHEHMLSLGYAPFVFEDDHLVAMREIDPPHPNVFYLDPANTRTDESQAEP